MDESRVGVAVRDTNATVQAANAAYLSEWASGKDIRSQPSDTYLPTGIAELARRTDRRVIDTGEIGRFAFHLPTSGQERERFFAVKYPLFNSGGLPAGILAIIKPQLEPEPLRGGPASHDVKRLLDATDKLGHFTPRQRSVVIDVCRGRLNKQIAKDLGVSIRTVETYRRKAMTAFGVDSLAELVRLMVAIEDAGLLPRSEDAA